MSTVILSDLNIDLLTFGPLNASTYGGIASVLYDGKPLTIKLPKLTVAFDTDDFKPKGAPKNSAGSGKYTIVADACDLCDDDEAVLLAMQDKLWAFLRANLKDVQALGDKYQKFKESKWKDGDSLAEFMSESGFPIIAQKSGSAYKNLKIKLTRKKDPDTVFTNKFKMDGVVSEWSIDKVKKTITKGAEVEAYVRPLVVAAVGSVGMTLYADTTKIIAGSGAQGFSSDDDAEGETEETEGGETEGADDPFAATIRQFNEPDAAPDAERPKKKARRAKE